MVVYPCSFTLLKAGKSMPARTAMIAITTSNSINVKLFLLMVSFLLKVCVVCYHKPNKQDPPSLKLADKVKPPLYERVKGKIQYEV